LPLRRLFNFRLQ